jgi:hypothetical protein
MAKGSQFERDICRQLSLWWTNGESDSVFWRTSNSGGRATVRSRKGLKTKNHYGDIMAVDPIGEPFLNFFTVELKRGYNRHSIADLLDQDKPLYLQWIKKACKEVTEAGSKHWLLIVKRDRRETIVMMPLHAAETISNNNNFSTIHGFLMTIATMPIRRFLAISPKWIIKYAQLSLPEKLPTTSQTKTEV